MKNTNLTRTFLTLLFLAVSALPARAYTLFEVPTTWDAIWNGTAEAAGGTVDNTSFWHNNTGEPTNPLGVTINYNPPYYTTYNTLAGMNNILIGNGWARSNTSWLIGEANNLYLVDDFASGDYPEHYAVGLEMLHNANFYGMTYITSGSTVNQATGTYQLDHGSLYIGDCSAGTYNLEGGAFVISDTAAAGSRVKSYDLHVGSNLKDPATAGTGTFNLAGGTATIPSEGKVYIGTVDGSGNALSTGTINMTTGQNAAGEAINGTLTAPEIQVVNGAFNFTAGTIKTNLMTVEKNGTLGANANFIVDTNNVKTLTFNDGKINFATGDTTIYVGNSGTGVWNIQNSGTAEAPFTINGTIRAGYGSNAVGTINITDSTVQHTGSYLILSNSGKAELNITNATLQATKNFFTGDSRNVTTSQTTINLNDGGKIESAATVSLSDKNNTRTTVNVNTGGNWTANGTLKIGYSNHWGDEGTNHQDGGTVAFNLLGGSVNAKAVNIGKTSALNVGDGTFDGTGAMVIYGTSEINVGGTEGKTGTMTLSSTLNTYENSVMTVKPGGYFNSTFSNNSTPWAVFHDSSSLVVDGGTFTNTGTGTTDLVFADTSSMKVQNTDSNLNVAYRLKLTDTTESVMSAGSLTTGNDFVLGYKTNSAGTAKFNVTGGTVNVGATLVLGVHADAPGEMTIGGGSGTATVTTKTFKLGERSTEKSTITLNPNGLLDVTGSNSFTIGHEAGGLGELILNGGSFNAPSASNGYIVVGYSGTGILTKADASTSTIPSIIRLGQNATGKGILNVYDGTLQNTGSYILTGINGNAEINVVGGTLKAKNIYLGDSAAALTSNVIVKENEDGRPGILTSENALWIADKNRTTGNVDVQEGGSVTAASTKIGFSQHFTDANGTHVGGVGTLLVSGGTYTSTGSTQVGERGTLKVTDGSYTGNGNAQVVGTVQNSYAADPNAHGYILLDGDDAQMTFKGDVNISGTAVTELKNGTFTANASGKSVTVGAPFSTGNTAQVLVDGESQLLIDGATATIGTLNIGDASSTHTGKVALNAGTLNVDTLNIVEGKGTFEMTGGTLNVTTSTADITQNGGFLSPGGNDAAAITTLNGNYTLAGGSIYINAGALDVIDENWTRNPANDLVKGGSDSELQLSGSVELDLSESLFSTLEIGDRIVIAEAPIISVNDCLAIMGSLPDLPGFAWNYGIAEVGGSQLLFAELTVPEPAAWLLLLLGTGLIFWRRKK